MANEAEWREYDVGNPAGVDQNAVSLIENARSNPTIIAIEGIANALEVRITDLLRPPRRRS
ncbi:helix-turn-helix transcriptional regulator [Bradyrhizobium sp. SZCCHNRI20481]|uniref:helix-turn-helix domain-containing protein n=1 Tax=Bradyrhizobium sp. SZCCHNRI20481 TaxID=3057286 RepID=UPI002915EF83|nr:helix-turn-helix transcriptional regulator [Bradyrhizobium sp. SZCCHNRI20481]